MSEINKLAQKHKNISNFAEAYFKNLNETFNNIDKQSIYRLEKEFLDIRKKTPLCMFLVMVVVPQQQ